MIDKQWICSLAIVFILGAVGFYAYGNQPLTLSPELAHKVGLQIWHNECGGKQEGLTTWNKGEDFASLGIGHFIWYPENKHGIFKETFPDLLIFLKSQRVTLPIWLDQAKGCPWKSREEFEQAQQETDLKELRQLLAQHVDLQIIFMVNRLEKALPLLLKSAPESLHSHLKFQFYRLAYTPDGIYVLLDYLNFKGEGTAPQERYNGKGWGLLQVLEQMRGTEPGSPAVIEFVNSAKKVLERRVENAPKERNETRWLKGWTNRLESYCRF